MEALTNIIIEHKHGAAIYMSKVTTEENLRTAGISLVACRPFTPLVIIFFSFNFAEDDYARLPHAFTLIMEQRHKKIHKSSRKRDTPEGSKRRSQSSSHREKKRVC